MALSKRTERYRKRDTFLSAYVANGGDRAKAEKQAGLSPGYGYTILDDPEMQKQIAARERTKLGELATICSDWAINAMLDPKKPDTIKRDITREVWKYYHGAVEGAGERKEAHEMTADEIAAEIRKLEGAASDQAKPVEQSKGGSTPFD